MCRANVRSIDLLERGGEVGPVGDLRPGVSVGIGLGHATRDGLPIEVFELR